MFALVPGLCRPDRHVRSLTRSTLCPPAVLPSPAVSAVLLVLPAPVSHAAEPGLTQHYCVITAGRARGGRMQHLARRVSRAPLAAMRAAFASVHAAHYC
jgi:hypothetical protein